MGLKKARLIDVAKEAGVAPNTASTILNRRPNSWASKATEERVFAAAEKLGYQPNRAALGLRLGTHHAVGLVVPDLHNPFYTRLADLIGLEFRKYDYDLVLENTQNDLKHEEQAVKRMMHRQVDAGIYLLASPPSQLSVLEAYQKAGRPTLLISADSGEQLPVDAVLVNFRPGLEAAVKHMLELGHRQFAFHSALAEDQKDPLRYPVVLECLQRAGLDGSHIRTITSAHDISSIYQAALEHLQTARPRPTAIIATNDLAAIGVARAATECGLKVPEDLSILGCDNILIGRYLPRRLSTIGQSMQEIAVNCTRLLMNRIESNEKGDYRPFSIHIESRYIEGETIAPPA